ESPGQVAGVQVPPAAVHPGPAADRCHRPLLLQSADPAIRVPARAHLHQRVAGRRDQSCHAPHAGRPAGMHGGTPGHPGDWDSAPVEEYIVAIVRSTRSHPEIELGASPRGSLGLHRTAQALAAIRSRSFVLPDDVKMLVPYVLPHRLITTSQARLRERGAREIAAEILKSVPAPVEAE